MSANIAYRFDLRKVPVMNDEGGKDVKGGELDYGSMYRQIIITPTGSGGVSADETLQAYEALQPLKKARKSNETFMLLSVDEYEHFKTKLASFRFAMAWEAVTEFIMYARNLEKVDMVVALPADRHE